MSLDILPVKMSIVKCQNVKTSAFQFIIKEYFEMQLSELLNLWRELGYMWPYIWGVQAPAFSRDHQGASFQKMFLL